MIKPNQGNQILTPQTHEDGKEYCGWVVKQISEPGELATVGQFLILAGSVA